VSFAAITFCVASQQVFIVVSVYGKVKCSLCLTNNHGIFLYDSVRKLLDTHACFCSMVHCSQ
jgi:hypothetical protein